MFDVGKVNEYFLRCRAPLIFVENKAIGTKGAEHRNILE
jgi:2-methylaconitate cis-trans-isomerase PrpF